MKKFLLFISTLLFNFSIFNMQIEVKDVETAPDIKENFLNRLPEEFSELIIIDAVSNAYIIEETKIAIGKLRLVNKMIYNTFNKPDVTIKIIRQCALQCNKTHKTCATVLNILPFQEYLTINTQFFDCLSKTYKNNTLSSSNISPLLDVHFSFLSR